MHTDAGVNALINLEVEGSKHLALARDIQRHPVRNTVAHVDFLVVNRNETITADVPLNFIGEATGVTKNGGIVEHLLTSLTITATPTTIPVAIDVDIANLQLDESIRVKDLPLPDGVTTTYDPEEAVVVGALTRAAAGGGTEEGAEGEGAPAEA
jgi:large subunit ribosomal protein L25